MKTRRWIGRDEGETLLELVISVVILGISIVAILGGFATSIRMSDVHRKEANAGATVRDYGEWISNYVATSASGYAACAQRGVSSPYAPTAVGFTTTPANYTASVTDVSYWNANGTAFISTCPATDQGVERLTLTVVSSDTRASESLSIVIRRPCRTTDVPAC
jgi:type II secretory pathway pseudopilin PulG